MDLPDGVLGFSATMASRQAFSEGPTQSAWPHPCQASQYSQALPSWNVGVCVGSVLEVGIGPGLPRSCSCDLVIPVPCSDLPDPSPRLPRTVLHVHVHYTSLSQIVGFLCQASATHIACRVEGSPSPHLYEDADSVLLPHGVPEFAYNQHPHMFLVRVFSPPPSQDQDRVALISSFGGNIPQLLGLAVTCYVLSPKSCSFERASPDLGSVPDLWPP